MVCPDCGRIISDNEICPCKMESIRRKNWELKKEEEARVEEEARLAAEREAKFEENKEKISKKATFAKNKTADISDNIIQQVLTILKSPEEGISEFVNEANTRNAMILIIIQSIFTGLFYMLSLSTSLLSSFSNYFEVLNKFSIFIIAIFISIITNVLFSFVLMISSGICKNSIDLKEALCLSSCKTVLTIPLTLLALIMISLSPFLGVIFMLISLISGVCLHFIGFNKLINNQDNFIYYIVINYLISFTIIFIILKIITFIL